MNLKWTRIVGAVSAVALIAGSSAAFATSSSGAAAGGDPAARASEFLSGVAQRVGVTPQKLLDAMKAEAKEQVDAAVADGKLTKEIADRIKARIDEATVERPFGVGPGFGVGKRFLHGPGRCTAPGSSWTPPPATSG